MSISFLKKPIDSIYSCGSSGRAVDRNAFKSDTVKVKQEPGTEGDVCSFSGPVKQEKSEDGRRSACMVRTYFKAGWIWFKLGFISQVKRPDLNKLNLNHNF